MLRSVIQQAAKNKRMFFSFLAVIFLHAFAVLVLSIVLDSQNELEASMNMPYSAESTLATVQKFIEVEFEEYPIVVNDNDIIELIEIKKEEPKKEVVKKKEVPKEALEAEQTQDSSEKSDSNTKDMPESVGLSMSFKQDYLGMVIAKLARNKYYPTAEKNRGREGSVVVSFSIDPSGQASNIRVSGSSGNANLDKAAAETVRRSSPFAAFEGSSNLDISLTLDFKIE